MAKNRTNGLPLPYQPLGFALSWAGGALAGLAFRKVWMAIRHEEHAPGALDPDRGWGEILLASAVHGAIFSVVRTAVDRTGAKAVARSRRMRTAAWARRAKCP